MTVSVDWLAAQVLAGERRALARAITLIESTRPEDHEQGEALLEKLLPKSGRAVRVGISGAPGVGKSTFTEALGLHLIDQGHKVAVLAIDPTGARGGGAILGDKTRMPDLARNPRSFIRPSPAGGALGGVARRTREALLACEAAGFDVVIVETVGVGQSEAAVADMVDTFLLLIQPGAGDELQGLKRGVIELADLVVVNKADGALVVAAERARADYRAALQLFPRGAGGWTPRVELCSALKREGIDAVWDAVQEHRDALEASGAMAAKREAQARAWMWREVRETLISELKRNPEVARLARELEARVKAGTLAPSAAAGRLIEGFLGREAGAFDLTPAGRSSKDRGLT